MEETSESQSTVSSTESPENPGLDDKGLDTIEAGDLDDETLLRLKGDCIGDSMYSASFVVGTLLKLNDLDWNESLESDLCTVWDMSIEKDVCDYLFSVGYPSIACSAVLNYMNNERLIEIVIGILGNMFCTKCNASIKDAEIQLVISTLNTTDPGILTQTVRFLRGLLHRMDKYEFITEEIVDKVTFILGNSLNQQLLEEALEFATYIHQDKVEFSCIPRKFLHNIFRTYKHLVSHREEIDTDHHMLALKLVFRIMSNIADYYELRILGTSEDVLRKLEVIAFENENDIAKLCRKVVRFFGKKVHLTPIPEEVDSYFLAILNVCKHGLYKYNLSDLLDMLKTINVIRSEYNSNEFDDITECFFLPLCEWIERVPCERLISDLSDERNIIDTLEYIKIRMAEHNLTNLDQLIIDLKT